MDSSQYAVAQRRSYEAQGTSFSVPIGVSEIPLGFQPMGIQRLGNVVTMAAYFEPAVVLFKVRVDVRGLHFDDLRWVRGVKRNDDSVRMFPDIYQPGGANRMQTCIPFTLDHLGLVRNGERSIFMIRERDGNWHYESRVDLPASSCSMINSVLMRDDKLYMIESDDTLEHWHLCTYQDSRLISEVPSKPWRYGLDIRSDGTLVTIADFRARSPGLFFNDEIRIPDIYGNGIVLLDDGKSGALVTRYGHGHRGPFNGVPGLLQYVHPLLLGL